MKQKVMMGMRVLLGLIFTVFGANGLMMFTTGSGFIPMPPPPEHMMQVMSGLMALKYLLPVVKVIETFAGLLLLANRYVNLALVLLAPIVFNILCIHVFIDMSGLPMALAVTVMNVMLIMSRFQDFKPILKA